MSQLLSVWFWLFKLATISSLSNLKSGLLSDLGFFSSECSLWMIFCFFFWILEHTKSDSCDSIVVKSDYVFFLCCLRMLEWADELSSLVDIISDVYPVEFRSSILSFIWELSSTDPEVDLELSQESESRSGSSFWRLFLSLWTLWRRLLAWVIFIFYSESWTSLSCVLRPILLSHLLCFLIRFLTSVCSSIDYLSLMGSSHINLFVNLLSRFLWQY